MAARRGKKNPEPSLTREELTAIVREVVARASGVTGAGLKKALPAAAKLAKEQALSVARELASRDELVRWTKGTKECFFERDPIPTLDGLAQEVLSSGPLTEAELKKRISAISPAHVELLSEWKRGALARRVVFEHLSKPKRLGSAPDIRGALSKPLDALKKSIASLELHGVSRPAVAAVLRTELGLAEPEPLAVSGRPREILLGALRSLVRENPSGSLLSLRELRARVSLDKDVFDATALALSKEGVVVLHHHDYPDSLSASEKRELVQDGRGTSYVGIAPRGWS
jgi:hypothetical protein